MIPHLRIFTSMPYDGFEYCIVIAKDGYYIGDFGNEKM